MRRHSSSQMMNYQQNQICGTPKKRQLAKFKLTTTPTHEADNLSPSWTTDFSFNRKYFLNNSLNCIISISPKICLCYCAHKIFRIIWCFIGECQMPIYYLKTKFSSLVPNEPSPLNIFLNGVLFTNFYHSMISYMLRFFSISCLIVFPLQHLVQLLV